MGIFSLTAGALEDINSSKDIKDPVLKVLGYKPVPGGTSNQNRYRLLLSDGVTTHTYCMLATQLNNLIEQNKMTTNSVIRVKKYVCNSVQNNKHVLIILDVDILGIDDTETKPQVPAEPERKPLQPSLHSATTASRQPESSTSVGSTPPRSSSGARPFSATGRSTGGPNTPGTPGSGGSGRVFPIQSLNPYQNRWTIKARVSQKSSIRTWSNAKGEGKLFSFTMCDESGEIKVTAFQAEVDKFFDLVQLDKVYLVSRATLKAANKQFNSTNNDYEMSLNTDSMLQPVEDEDNSSLPQIHFQFVQIASLQTVEVNSFVDIVGVVHEVSDLQSMTSRTTQRELKKRDVTLVDNSNCMVKLTLWGEEAAAFDGSSHPAVVVKAARVSDFGGRSLSTTSSTTLLIAPTHVPEAIRLKGWYEHEGRQGSFGQFKMEGGSGGGGPAAWKVLSEVKGGSIGTGDKPDYFTVKGTVVHLKKDNCMYQSCPTDSCNKKIIDMGQGLFRCEKCNKETPDYKWRLLLQLNICDMTDNQWVTAFQESAEVIMQKSADELGSMRENNFGGEFDAAFQEANFTSFIFRMRAKMETYNDENRLRVVLVDAKPIDYKDYNKRLLDNIELLSKELPATVV